MSTIMRTGGLDRRRFIKTAAAAGAMTVASPFVLKGALGAGGELNFLGWAGYDGFAAVFKQFEAKTGVKVKFTGFGSQDEFHAQAKAGGATNGAFDMAEPTSDRLASWLDNDFIVPWDEKKAGLDGVDPAFLQGKAADAMTIKGKRYGMPSVWGTESLTFNNKEVKLEYGKASLMDLFDDKYVGKVTMRGHSGLAAAARALEAAGKLPHPYAEAYADEAKMVKIYDETLKFVLSKRKNIGQFWSNENEAQGAFRTNGCVIGMNWDTSAGAMIKEGMPISYISPNEGAMAWLQNFVLLKGAKNVEQVYEWIRWINTPDGAAAWSKAFSANPIGKGSVDKLDDAAKKFFQMAYPGDATSKLFWWPATPSWFVAKRTEYAKKFMSA
ncbi:MAG: extracellular solute-binding protein [Methylobacteriaceae bacterium]|nr:extracellular solute-binding protein [Methylobacteriaceae bacterium]